jgi:hypothetical protein
MSKFRLLILIAIGLSVTGCASQKAWKYGAEPFVNGIPPLVNKTVVVPPFNDQRINENDDKIALYLIPLMPFGWQDLNTPEGVQRHITSGLWLWRPNEDFAKASYEELNSSNIFKEVFYSTRASEGDLVLQGTIKSTKYNGKLLTYGLSAYGPIFWFLGLPAASVSNELIVTFKLEDRKNNRILWEKEYSDEVSLTSIIYSLRSDFQYPDMLKKILLNVVSDIKEDVPSLKTKLVD